MTFQWIFIKFQASVCVGWEVGGGLEVGEISVFIGTKQRADDLWFDLTQFDENVRHLLWKIH